MVPPLEIVGVVADAVYGSPRETPTPTMYTPMSQLENGAAMRLMSLSVRAERGPATALIKSVASAIKGVSPDVTLTFQPLADQVNASLTQERLVALLSGAFGALALLLAGLGLYGVVSNAVTRRQSELGIRMALGATPGAVIRLVLSRVAVLVGAGVAIGLACSVWVARLVVGLLYGVTARDPVTLMSAAGVLIALATGAAAVPAWRASRLDPALTLRAD
jgi:ABC-type antimicrobial peptide transport system permease subunit